MGRKGSRSVAIGYVRVSTEDQKLGPEAQRAAIAAWAQREGVTVAAWATDAGVSGGSDLADRPALVAALSELRTHRAGILVVAKRDRLARDLYVAATIERAVTNAGASVACAEGAGNGDSPADAFMRGILDSAAAYERALIRARTKAALGAKRARGERVGSVPYGFRLADDGVRLEAFEAEQAVIATVQNLRSAGLSLRAVVAHCARAGLTSRSGRPFAKTQVERMTRATSMNAFTQARSGASSAT